MVGMNAFLDVRVQEYVLQQPLAQDFLGSLTEIFAKILPKVVEHKVDRYIIALGCTGGQHRSTTLVEALSKILSEQYPNFAISVRHRELAHLQNPVSNDQEISTKCNCLPHSMIAVAPSCCQG